MFEKKCKECSEKVDRKFNYCPWCGASMKARSSNMGMLGASDSPDKIVEDLKLPMGLDKIMGGLVKQLERQLGNMELDKRTGLPKGVKIQIGRVPAQGQVVQSKPAIKKTVTVVSEKENARRSKLKRVDANSKVKRLGDVIIYDIETPGVRSEDDVVITELEAGIEVRVYAKDQCYVKVIPLKVEVLGMKVSKERVLVELKG